tara:strand:+ start:149531 stop:149893 length:363 start_codon:yes stop_codon:yes gene_type:complete
MMKINIYLALTLFLITSCSSAPEYLSDDNKNIFIKNKIDASIPKYKSCFNQHKRNNIDKGIAKVSFTIGKSGKITEANTKLTSGRLNNLILKCMTNVSKNLSFPPSSIGEIQINQPINFH